MPASTSRTPTPSAPAAAATRSPDPGLIAFVLDGRAVEVPDDGASLLEVLRDRLGSRSAKDGCSPQGQCGCCTVWVDSAPRVACVTPARRVAGRVVTTVDGLEPDTRRRWAEAFSATGASQCGFCTPGIIMRLAALEQKTPSPDEAAVSSALLAHLCRCTGWRTILEAATLAGAPSADPPPTRDLVAAARRATIEGGSPQTVGPEVALGRGGFADDGAPADALVALPDGQGGWVVEETLQAARATAGKVQGRRTTLELSWPVEVPAGEWDLTLATTWVEPGYLEPDASWCEPGGEPASPLGNGGAFGAKVATEVAAVARRLADQHGRAVRVVLAREDAVRRGPKRPPLALGLRPDGSGVVRVARTEGIEAVIARVAPGLRVEQVEVPGPATSLAIRGAGWVEVAAALGAGRARSAGTTRVEVTSPEGARAAARVNPDGRVEIEVSCGEVLDQVVLRSYCIGAAHMGLGLVRSEGIAVDAAGQIHDLTIRSFGILRARDTPAVAVHIDETGGPAVNGSDAVMAAVAGAAWLADGLPGRWPHQKGSP